MIQHQMNTQPLILCAILVAIGICMGVTLGMIAHVVLKEPAVDTKKEEWRVCCKQIIRNP